MSSHKSFAPLKEEFSQHLIQQLPFEEEIYGLYLKSFMKNFQHFLHANIGVNQGEKLSLDIYEVKAVTQRLTGDVNFVTAIFSEKDFFVKLANRYSGENFSSFDEMVIDSAKEFLNVMNGYYAILMAKSDIVLDLEAPRHGRKILLPLEHNIEFRMDSELGSFLLVFLTGEVIA